jgi:transglutaminase-like putative cysteine protease
MAIMLRTLGIPSREVNGFLPGEYNDVAGDYIVRASDAHSWVEAYFPGSGWVTFDPTPPGAEDATGLFSRLAMSIGFSSTGTSGSLTTISRIRSNWRETSGKIPRIGLV